MQVQTLTESLESFLTEADTWLTPMDAPAVASLRIMAATLDSQNLGDGIVPSLMSQYMNTYRALAKRQPVSAPEEDALDAALKNTDGPLQMTPSDDG